LTTNILNTMDKEVALKVDVMSFAYRDGKAIVLPRFELRAKEIVVIAGRSGAGKSTLLHLATGVLALNRADGSVSVGTHELAGCSQTERDSLRPHIVGWVPQRAHLISALNVFDNVMLPISMGVRKQSTRSDYVARAKQLLRDAGIDSIANALPSNISVGQASRACAARALVANPRLLCADEPTAALDRESADAMARLFAHYVEDGGAALIATHDRAFVESLARESSAVRTIDLEAT
jgi:ABC-type lipoprotein export system ATPase subunit